MSRQAVKGHGRDINAKSTGLRILRTLNGTVPGYAIPLFMQDTPGGGGKHPLGP